MSFPSQRGRTPARSDGAAPNREEEASKTREAGRESVDRLSHWNDSVDRRYEDSFRSTSAPGL